MQSYDGMDSCYRTQSKELDKILSGQVTIKTVKATIGGASQGMELVSDPLSASFTFPTQKKCLFFSAAADMPLFFPAANPSPPPIFFSYLF